MKDFVPGTLHFLPRDPLFEIEKPYSIQYSPHGDVPQTNVTSTPEHNVPVYNLRSLQNHPNLEKDGFTFCRLDSQMSYTDFAYPAHVEETYLPEIRGVLERITGCDNVTILEYLIRRRHASYPVSTGEEFEFAQPVATAHVDFSPSCIDEIIEDRYADRAPQLQGLRHQVINVWKPLRAPPQDWPLALCRPSSVSVEHDIQLMDRVYPRNVEESLQFHYNKKQEWFYLEDHQPAELLIFLGGDSALGLAAGVPHCSFHNPRVSSDVLPRESVEVRAIVFYSDNSLDLARVVESRLHGPKSTYQQHQY